MLSGRLSFISQGAKPGVMSVGASIKGSGRGGSGRGDNGRQYGKWLVTGYKEKEEEEMTPENRIYEVGL